MSEEGEQAGVVSVKGTLAISGGSLEVSNGLEASTVASLTINGGELTGVATIDVSGSLFWSGLYGQMSGLGKTVIEPGASATLKENVMRLKGGRTLVNEGSMSLEAVEIYMSEGAVLENKGTFYENSEYGSPQINVEAGGATPSILNTGTFEKTEGSGNGDVAVPFVNRGTVAATSGELKFADGGSSESAAWTASPGARIVFSSGSFGLSHGSLSGAIAIEGYEAANVSAEAVAATAAKITLNNNNGSLNVTSGTMTIESLTLALGEVAGAGGFRLRARPRLRRSPRA